MSGAPRRGGGGGYAVRLLLLAFFAVAVILPLICMLTNIDRESLGRVVRSEQFRVGALHSLAVSLTATAISIGVAFLLSWSLARTGIRYKSVIAVLLTVPMLVPSISHSTGLIMLFGSNGFFTKLLGMQGSIYGFWGIVLGSVMYSFPFAFLMLYDVMRYEDYTPYEAAQVLGIPKWKQLRDITFSYLKKPMISVLFSTFTIIFTDYGVPIAIGGKYVTLPVIMYQEVIGQLNFAKGSVIGAVLLLPAVISFLIDTLAKDKGRAAYITKPYLIKSSPLRDRCAGAFCLAVCLYILFVNLSFGVLAFARSYPTDMSFTLANVQKAFQMNGLRYLGNSLAIALLVAALGTTVGFTAAYCSARLPSALSRWLHLSVITSLAIPGIVLGISYVLFFKSTALYGTLLLLVMVNIAHFAASPYLMMYNTFGKMNANLEAVGDTLGISRLRLVLDVFIPQVKNTLLEMASYLFVNSMITISAVSFLATTVNKPLSLMMNQFDALMLTECSAVISVLLLGINLAVKCVVWLLKRKTAVHSDCEQFV